MDTLYIIRAFNGNIKVLEKKIIKTGVKTYSVAISGTSLKTYKKELEQTVYLGTANELTIFTTKKENIGVLFTQIKDRVIKETKEEVEKLNSIIKSYEDSNFIKIDQ